jgi:N-methylhydantoinase A/oxoprolinase/acetone carboxylase beta subunit
VPLLRTPRARALPRSALRGHRPAVFERALRVRVLEREALPLGCVFTGPALIEEYSGTTLVPPGWRARVTAGGHLWLARPPE